MRDHLILTLLALLFSQEPLCYGQELPSHRLSGGETTVFQSGQNAFSLPLANISRAHRREHVVGNSFFNKNWIAAPGSPSARDGLGPLFNARSCSACHLRDGRGQPFRVDGTPLALIFRLSIPGQTPHGGPIPVPNLGLQLATQALPSIQPEGTVLRELRTISGEFDDGNSYQLHKSVFQIQLTRSDQALPQNLLVGPRLAPPVFGLGLLEAIPAESIQKNADPQDQDHDGISGRYNWVWNSESHQHELGRFGWKANQASLRTQIAAAFVNDIGITSTVHPIEALTADQKTAYSSLAHGGRPELDDRILDRVVSYQATLAPPARRDLDDPDVQQGWRHFQNFNCQACHHPTFETGRHPEFEELSFQTIHPFSDLLLHDMGPGLADARPDFQATGSEWRTPPLWGLGLTRAVNGNEFYLHDGRARSLEEAILWHGGEAEASRVAFQSASHKTRAQLLSFLNSL